MAQVRHRTLHTGEIAMHVAEAGEGRPVVFLHGFPETWRCWRHQLDAVADAGWWAVAPDQRGYGGTDQPEVVEQYDLDHLVGDVVGLIDALGEPSAVVVGHDWGAAVAWWMARMVPERVEAVVGLSVPAFPKPSAPPATVLAEAMGDRFHYIVYFQEPGPADRELGADPERSLHAFYSAADEALMSDPPREGTGVLDVLGEPGQSPEWLNDQDVADAAADFARTGFTGGLNWYRNLDRNYELAAPFADRTVDQPALYVAGADDPVMEMWPPSLMEGLVSDLRGCLILEDTGHWVQQQRPDQVNAALLDFLAGLPAR